MRTLVSAVSPQAQAASNLTQQDIRAAISGTGSPSLQTQVALALLRGERGVAPHMCLARYFLYRAKGNPQIGASGYEQERVVIPREIALLDHDPRAACVLHIHGNPATEPFNSILSIERQPAAVQQVFGRLEP
jgi:hypothetical protein